MAKAYVTEYSGPLGGGSSQVVGSRSIRTQVVDFSGGAARTALPFSANTTIVRVNVDAICCKKTGDSTVTATTSDERMDVGTEYFGEQAGDYLSFISTT
jgi:hypothetical protein